MYLFIGIIFFNMFGAGFFLSYVRWEYSYVQEYELNENVN